MFFHKNGLNKGCSASSTVSTTAIRIASGMSSSCGFGKDDSTERLTLAEPGTTGIRNLPVNGFRSVANNSWSSESMISMGRLIMQVSTTFNDKKKTAPGEQKLRRLPKRLG